MVATIQGPDGRRTDGDTNTVYDRARECSSSLIISAIAITALVLPVVVLGPRAGLEILHPLAVVLLGGLVSSLVVALFVVPSAYLHLVPQQASDAPPEHEDEPEPVAAGPGAVL
jgi:Cu/Ag efflux pump CusA